MLYVYENKLSYFFEVLVGFAHIYWQLVGV